MTLVSLTAYAATHGATKQSASEWKARGYLVVRDGLVDAEASDAKMQAAAKGRFRVKAHGGRREAGVQGVVDRPGLPSPPKGGPRPAAKGRGGKARAKAKPPASAEELADALVHIADDKVGDFLANLLGGNFASTARAEQIKENGLAAKHLIAARKEAGNLIEVEIAEAVLFQAARAARDAWLNFPSRIGPLLAADLDTDTDRLVEALSAHVQDQLEQLGTPKGEFYGA